MTSYINLPRVLRVWSFHCQLNFGECSYLLSAENNNKIIGLGVIVEIFVKSEQYTAIYFFNMLLTFRVVIKTKNAFGIVKNISSNIVTNLSAKYFCWIQARNRIIINISALSIIEIKSQGELFIIYECTVNILYKHLKVSINFQKSFSFFSVVSVSRQRQNSEIQNNTLWARNVTVSSTA